VSRHAAASLVVAGCASAWGLIAIVVREIDLPPLAMVFYRVALTAGAVAAALLLMRRRELLRVPNRAVFALGVLVAFHWSAYFWAIKETSIASAVLITYAAPVLMALIAPLLIGELVPRVSVAALAVSLSGIALITLSRGEAGGAVRPLGVLLAALAAVSFAFLLVLLKRYAADVDPLTWVLWESVSAAAVLSPAAVLGGLPQGAADVGYLLFLGLFLTGLLSVFFIAAVRFVPATTAGILMYMEPVSAALLAAVLLGEPLTWQVAVGGAAIVAAGVAVVVRTPDPPHAPVEEPVPLGAPVREPARAPAG
jgi:drug/metabolite transporter, DME family